MLHLVIDIDGVLCDHAESICRVVNQDFSTTANASDVTTRNHDFGPITFHGAVDKYYPDRDFILSMQPHLGAVRFLQIVRHRFRVTVATTRPVSQEATEEWLTAHFGDGLQLMFVEQKVDLSPDIIIDDSLSEVVAVCQRGGVGILMSRPWNNDAKTVEATRQHNRLYVASDFGAVCAILRSNGLDQQLSR